MTKYATVWRVETANGTGAYTTMAQWSMEDFSERYRQGARERCPAPMNDPLLGDFWADLGCYRHNWYFGFSTLAAAKVWFFDAKLLRHFDDIALLLRKYRVPAEYVKRGTTQTIFLGCKAQLVETRTCGSLI